MHKVSRFTRIDAAVAALIAGLCRSDAGFCSAAVRAALQRCTACRCATGSSWDRSCCSAVALALRLMRIAAPERAVDRCARHALVAQSRRAGHEHARFFVAFTAFAVSALLGAGFAVFGPVALVRIFGLVRSIAGRGGLRASAVRAARVCAARTCAPPAGACAAAPIASRHRDDAARRAALLTR